jgi:hypothetical protein
MLLAAPPMISTGAPGVRCNAGTTARYASGMLSLALATDIGSTPSGSRTSIESAKGTRTRSLTMPPKLPTALPKP